MTVSETWTCYSIDNLYSFFVDRTENHIKNFLSEKWTRIILVFLVTWTLVIYYFYPLSQVSCSSNEDIPELKEKLYYVLTQLDRLRQRHSLFLAAVKQSPWLINSSVPDNPLSLVIPYEEGPTEEYEVFRRRLYFSTKEMWYYLRYQLTKALDEDFQRQKRIMAATTEEVADRKRWLLAMQEQLPMSDGREKWRRQEAASVSSLVQRRLRFIQHPEDCRPARKLVCPYEWLCGFGCDILYLASCLVQAYATKRTLILRHDTWQYSNRKTGRGWNRVFHPLSDNCREYYNETYAVPSTGVSDRFAKVLYFPTMYYRSIIYDKHLPPVHYIPQDLAQRIVRFSSDPASWWIGQMLKYILKPRLTIKKSISDALEELDIKSPIVGIHVRRTDKLENEADLHTLEEYMSVVEDYYAQLELTVVVDIRRVYLATDDVDVLKEAELKYPQYKFYSNYTIAKQAEPKHRYTIKALTGLLIDIYMLTTCDYVVVTLSSNIGRMVNGLMHTVHIDISKRLHSLDYTNYYYRTEPLSFVAVMRNAHIAFEIGDIIQAYHWHPNSDGIVLRTKVFGRIPWYKTKKQLVLYSYPKYEEVPIQVEDPPDIDYLE